MCIEREGNLNMKISQVNNNNSPNFGIKAVASRNLIEHFTFFPDPKKMSDIVEMMQRIENKFPKDPRVAEFDYGRVILRDKQNGNIFIKAEKFKGKHYPDCYDINGMEALLEKQIQTDKKILDLPKYLAWLGKRYGIKVKEATYSPLREIGKSISDYRKMCTATIVELAKVKGKRKISIRFEKDGSTYFPMHFNIKSGTKDIVTWEPEELPTKAEIKGKIPEILNGLDDSVQNETRKKAEAKRRAEHPTPWEIAEDARRIEITKMFKDKGIGIV